MSLILILDAHGQPNKWGTWMDAVTYHAKDQVIWSIGEVETVVRGGQNRITGEQSIIKTSSIIAVRGESKRKKYVKPPLNNKELFRRDKYLCAYCGKTFSEHKLTRDHVTPKALKGKDIWENVVTACGPCNQKKDDMTLEEAGMELLYVPYVPSRAESLILQNRNVLYDQMQFLLSFVPESSRLKK